MGLLFHYVKSGRTDDEIANAAIKLCINLKMQTPRVCAGIIKVYTVSLSLCNHFNFPARV